LWKLFLCIKLSCPEICHVMLNMCRILFFAYFRIVVRLYFSGTRIAFKKQCTLVVYTLQVTDIRKQINMHFLDLQNISDVYKITYTHLSISSYITRYLKHWLMPIDSASLELNVNNQMYV